MRENITSTLTLLLLNEVDVGLHSVLFGGKQEAISMRDEKLQKEVRTYGSE